MNDQDRAYNVVRLFGMTNLMLESELESVEREHEVTLRSKRERELDKDGIYYPQFPEVIRQEAEAMARHYEIFYCLEKSARTIVNDRLREASGADWWDKHASDAVKKEVAERIQREVDSGMTLRSSDPIDFTTFGELGEIIRDNWELFGDTFNSKKALSKIMTNLNMLRGPIAHSCRLAENEVLRLKLSFEDWFRLME